MPWFMALAPGQHDVKAIVTKTPVKLTGFTELPAPALPEPAVSPEQLGKLKPQTKERGTPQKIVLCPSATKCVSGRLVGFRKGGQQEEAAAPKKAGTFAQDMCSYFVMPAPDTKKK